MNVFVFQNDNELVNRKLWQGIRNRRSFFTFQIEELNPSSSYRLYIASFNKQLVEETLGFVGNSHEIGHVKALQKSVIYFI